MCILFIAVEQHPIFPLIIAANRDEFYPRPTQESHFWHDHKNLLAGKDLQAGGTWMGVNTEGGIAALTNIRNPEKHDNELSTSRGHIVSSYLLGDTPESNYIQNLKTSRNTYNGYNLLFGKWNQLQVYNNHDDSLQKLTPGFYGLSNADLNSPWPKINSGVSALETYCSENADLDVEQLFALLMDETKADDSELPNTGVPYEWEKKLSSIFIRSEGYGTRSSTILTVDQNQRLSWYEHTFNDNKQVINTQYFHFNIENS